MTTNSTIHLVAVCDNDYVILLAALLKSIEQTHVSGEKIEVYFICDNVSQENKSKLQKSIISPLLHITTIDMLDALPKGMKLPMDRSLFPLNVYVRLYIPYFSFIPKDVERILYIDVDMILQEDISKLYFADMQDKTMAAVLDPRLLTFDNSWGGILNYKELNLPGSAPYFNAGLLLINRPKWIAEDITEKVVDIIDMHTKFANYPDQYGLNIVFTNNWHRLADGWNHFSSGEQQTEKPFLIHFTSRKPIYKTYTGKEEYKAMFFKYLHQTEWKKFKTIGESARYVKKLKIVWDKVKKTFS